MSPEQCKGTPLDRRSDIFSLGTVLFEVSTGRRLFKRASDMLTFEAICKGAIPKPSDVVKGYPPKLEAVVLRALQRDRDDRYDDAAEMRHDLLRAMRTLERRAPSALPVPRPAQPPGEVLAAMMRSLFGDRIRDKREVIRRIQERFAAGQHPAGRDRHRRERLGARNHRRADHRRFVAVRPSCRWPWGPRGLDRHCGGHARVVAYVGIAAALVLTARALDEPAAQALSSGQAAHISTLLLLATAHDRAAEEQGPTAPESQPAEEAQRRGIDSHHAPRRACVDRRQGARRDAVGSHARARRHPCGDRAGTQRLPARRGTSRSERPCAHSTSAGAPAHRAPLPTATRTPQNRTAKKEVETLRLAT